MSFIESLHVEQCDNVGPGTRLTFSRRGGILVGRNGTGKTTLLRLLTAIYSGDWLSISTNDFKVSFVLFATDGTRFAGTVKYQTESAEHAPEPSRQTPDEHVLATLLMRQKRLDLDMDIVAPDKSFVAKIASRGSKAEYWLNSDAPFQAETGPTSGWHVLFPLAFLGGRDSSSPGPLIRSFSELLIASRSVRRFDEGLEYFRALTEATDGGLYIRSRAVVDGKAAVDFIVSRLVNPIVAQKLISSYLRNGDRHSFAFVDGSEVEYLALFCKLTGLEHMSLSVGLEEQSPDGALAFHRAMFLATNPQRSIEHERLSFGEKRLLAFLHYVDSHAGPVFADELVNGMHHEWIKVCLDLVDSRQVFLSSQNPLLFDFLTFDELKDVSSRFIMCSHADSRQFSWVNMSEDDAVEFLELYKVGISSVSEILRTRGYW